MEPLLSPAKVVLLAVHLAAHADIDSLSSLASQHPSVLRKDLLLRILLTHLPETTSSKTYVGFLQQLAAGEFTHRPDVLLDASPVQDLPDDHASRRVRKLHLLPLACPDAPAEAQDDSLALFLFRRAYRVDEEAGLLTQLPDLLTPFLEHTPSIRTWMASTVLPLLRRNYVYYAETTAAYSLLEFQKLPGVAAIDYLLAHTGQRQDHLGRDLRGLVSPWLYNDTHWRQTSDRDPELEPEVASRPTAHSPGWEHVLEWLTLKATQANGVAPGVIAQWDGPQDADCGEATGLFHQEPRLQYLQHSYAQAALAAAYLTPQAKADALNEAYEISRKVNTLLGDDSDLSLAVAASDLPDVPELTTVVGAKTASYMRNDLLESTNPLTTPSRKSTGLLATLVLSAFVTTRLGVPWTVRKAGQLAFVQDQREQKVEVSKLIRAIPNHASRNDDDYWTRVRREMLWLHGWGGKSVARSDAGVRGVLGMVSREYIEAELLKTLLLNSRKLREP